MYYPFIGSGTTALVALKNNRKYVGYDISEEYVKLAEDRIKIFQSQTKIEFDKKQEGKAKITSPNAAYAALAYAKKV